ncbi:MAG: prepilin peptidase [Oscillospiraceae bacterium]|nr:prepilin peptidase [Oscillospiraceae bacterium]MBQ9898470.1 prepilin peptidase [Ruminococcus sp.]
MIPLTSNLTVLTELVSASALLYGGVTDAKRREISNLVPVLLLLCGLLRGDHLYRVLSLLVVALVMWVCSRLIHLSAPGGDIKLLCSLAFCVGLRETLFVMLLSLLAVWLTKRKDGQIPLCTYVAPAYIIARLFVDPSIARWTISLAFGIIYAGALIYLRRNPN